MAQLEIPPISADARRRRRPHLSDEAAAYVRELIISGQLRPGTFIRPDGIAEDLGSSVTPVREALVMLRGEGFLEQAPRRGFRVAPLSGDDIRDLFAAQALLAGELAARAIDRCSDEQITQIRAVQVQLDRALERGALGELERWNHEFHRLITLGAASPRMARLLGLATTYVPRRFFAMIAGWPQASADDHVAIVDALEHRRRDAARTAMSQHFVHAGALLAAHLEDTGTPPVRAGALDTEDHFVWP